MNNNLSLQTDFNPKNIILNFNKIAPTYRIKFNNLENINLNFYDLKNNNEVICFISHIEKTFSFYEKTLNDVKSIKNLDKEISNFSQNIISTAKLNKILIIFLWPYDTNDRFMGSLNFRYGHKSWLINYINYKVVINLSKIENIVILDTNNLLLTFPKKIEIFDEKTKYLFNNSYSHEFQKFIAETINKEINSYYSKKIKLIILDCDNTLWGGEAGENNYDTLEIGQNSSKGIIFQSFQKRLKLLKSFGFILAICSKNFKENVFKVFKKNKNMILKLDDISSFRINWKDKSQNVFEIIQELNLRAENTLFIDDSPFERNIVKNILPEINIFNFPNNLLYLNNELNNLPGFDKNFISSTDIKRSELYNIESKRNMIREKFQDMEAWIKSLNIKIHFSKITNFQRSAEMFNRTNQFNTSHNRLGISDIRKISKLKNKIIFEIEAKDKFGNYGIISYIIIESKDNKFLITDFVLSCRVFRRQIEESILYTCYKILKNKKILIIVKKNKKNKYVQDFLANSNFLKKNNLSQYEFKEKIKFNLVDNKIIKVSKNI